MDDGAILVNDDIFDDVFVPERLIGREGHLKEIARCLAPVMSGKRATHVFIHGPPGVGKTLVCKKILRDHFPGNYAYVNVWSKRTEHKIIKTILEHAGILVDDRESTSELEKRLKSLDRKMIICLDESDHLKDDGILYSLASNAHGLILISNDSQSLSTIDDRIRSRILMNEIEFKPYTRDEILSILHERVSCGLRPGTVDANLLSIVAGMCNGDARIGLQVLKMAAREAETKTMEKITIEEVKKASKCVRRHSLSYLLRKLNDHQKVIFEILKDKGTMPSGRLYAEYCKAVEDPVVDRAYRIHMERIEELGLVKSEGSGRWKKYVLTT